MVKIVLVLFLILGIFCTSNDVATGGDDIANGYIQANCIDTLFNNISGASADLVGVYLTNEGDSSFYSSSDITDEAGICRFINVPDGQYVLTVKDTILNRGAIKTRITVNGDSIISSEALVLKKQSPIKGRIANYDQESLINVIVPGVLKSFKPDNNGFYTISNMYLGNYDICLISDSIINYLSLNIKSADGDTIYIRDIDFASSVSTSNGSVDIYEQDSENSFQIVPKYYDPQNEPAWYEDHDFNLVDYYENVDGKDSLLPQWHFPVIIGISDSTFKHFNSDSSSIADMIINQFQEASNIFNLATISGKINFSVDSIYLITEDPNNEAITPPAGFALRLIYDAFHEVATGNSLWGPENKCGVYAYSPTDPGGMFGDIGMRYLMWTLARSRGCFYMELCDIDSSKNLYNGEGFYLPNYIMTMRSLDVWSPTNEMIMNFTTNTLWPEAHIELNNFPNSVELLFVDDNLSPISGLNINIYASRQSDFTLLDSVYYSGIADSNGKFSFPERPFINVNENDIDYPTYLIEAMGNNDTTRIWFPVHEVIDNCFLEKKSSYIKTIIL